MNEKIPSQFHESVLCIVKQTKINRLSKRNNILEQLFSRKHIMSEDCKKKCRYSTFGILGIPVVIIGLVCPFLGTHHNYYSLFVIEINYTLHVYISKKSQRSNCITKRKGI